MNINKKKIVAFSGLHGVGKSFIAHQLANVTQADYFNKRDILKLIYNADGNVSDWSTAYRRDYLKYGAYKMMNRIMDYFLIFPIASNLIIFDSIHNIDELRLLKEYFNVILVLVVSTASLRLARLKKRDGFVKSNKTRISSAHKKNENEEISCLYSECDWSINNYDYPGYLKIQIDILEKYLINC